MEKNIGIAGKVRKLHMYIYDCFAFIHKQRTTGKIPTKHDPNIQAEMQAVKKSYQLSHYTFLSP